MRFSVDVSPFQRETILKIEGRSDFRRFHTTESGFELDAQRRPGPFMVLWSDIQGNMHGWRVGVKRVLRTVSATG